MCFDLSAPKLNKLDIPALSRPIPLGEVIKARLGPAKAQENKVLAMRETLYRMLLFCHEQNHELFKTLVSNIRISEEGWAYARDALKNEYDETEFDRLKIMALCRALSCQIPEDDQAKRTFEYYYDQKYPNIFGTQPTGIPVVETDSEEYCFRVYAAADAWDPMPKEADEVPKQPGIRISLPGMEETLARAGLVRVPVEPVMNVPEPVTDIKENIVEDFLGRITKPGIGMRKNVAMERLKEYCSVPMDDVRNEVMAKAWKGYYPGKKNPASVMLKLILEDLRKQADVPAEWEKEWELINYEEMERIPIDAVESCCYEKNEENFGIVLHRTRVIFKQRLRLHILHKCLVGRTYPEISDNAFLTPYRLMAEALDEAPAHHYPATAYTSLKEYPTYQAVFDIYPANGLNEGEECFNKLVLTVIDWFRGRVKDSNLNEDIHEFINWFPNPAEYRSFNIMEHAEYGMHFDNPLKVFYLPEEKRWAFYCLEPDNGTEKNAEEGRWFVTEIALTDKTVCTEMAVRITCREPWANTRVALCFRPGLIKNICNESQFVITEAGMPKECCFKMIECEDAVSLEENLINNPARQMPVVISLGSADDYLPVKLQGYAHVICAREGQMDNWLKHRENVVLSGMKLTGEVEEIETKILNDELMSYPVQKKIEFGQCLFVSQLRQLFLEKYAGSVSAADLSEVIEEKKKLEDKLESKDREIEELKKINNQHKTNSLGSNSKIRQIKEDNETKIGDLKKKISELECENDKLKEKTATQRTEEAVARADCGNIAPLLYIDPRYSMFTDDIRKNICRILIESLVKLHAQVERINPPRTRRTDVLEKVIAATDIADKAPVENTGSLPVLWYDSSDELFVGEVVNMVMDELKAIAGNLARKNKDDRLVLQIDYILDKNGFTDAVENKRQELYNALNGFTNGSQAVQVLGTFGFTNPARTGHYQMTYYNTDYIITISSTPSDRNTGKALAKSINQMCF